jgi:endonuclease YncB( thermonuclease family)
MSCRLVSFAALAVGALSAEDFTGKVVGISDGDTIRIMHNGVPERVRLWGIDCPESKQAFGSRARQFNDDLAFGQIVTVRVRDIARYKRTVAEIILPDGRNLNQELVRAGLAWWYQHYARRELILRDLEQEVRAARLGVWADPSPVPPWEWRARGRDSHHELRAAAPTRMKAGLSRVDVYLDDIQAAFARIFSSEFDGRSSRYPQIERRA